jgi:hypothetical protein
MSSANSASRFRMSSRNIENNAAASAAQRRCLGTGVRSRAACRLHQAPVILLERCLRLFGDVIRVGGERLQECFYLHAHSCIV